MVEIICSFAVKVRHMFTICGENIVTKTYSYKFLVLTPNTAFLCCVSLLDMLFSSYFADAQVTPRPQDLFGTQKIVDLGKHDIPTLLLIQLRKQIPQIVASNNTIKSLIQSKPVPCTRAKELVIYLILQYATLLKHFIPL